MQESIYKEASSLNEFLTIEDIRHAHYTRAVLYETFRLTPTAPAIARIIENDLELSGYLVKGGVRSLHCLNRIKKNKNIISI